MIRLRNFWKEWKGNILFIAVLLPFKSVIADLNPVPTGSMNPTILEGDVVLSNKLAYSLKIPFTLNHVVRWSNPKRGDIVICFSPEDEIRLVKRLIAVPGDRVSMQNNRLHINGECLSYTEPKLNHSEMISNKFKGSAMFAEEGLPNKKHPVMALPVINPHRNFKEITLGNDEYFIMGDNRDNSKDSRAFGVVSIERIVGRAEAVVASLDIIDSYMPRFERFFTKLN